MSYEGPWRNGDSFHSVMYNQHCRLDELLMYSPKLHALLLRYGCAFDDVWYYWLSNSSKRYVKRNPLWLNGQKRIDIRNGKDSSQRKLFLSE